MSKLVVTVTREFKTDEDLMHYLKEHEDVLSFDEKTELIKTGAVTHDSEDLNYDNNDCDVFINFKTIKEGEK